MISLEEACSLLLENVPSVVTEEVTLGESLGRVAGHDVLAPWDLPGEVRSRLDGYALRSSDFTTASESHPVQCRLLTGLIAAGHARPEVLEAGTCRRIMTGAPLPMGADAVLAQELAVTKNGFLELGRPVAPGSGLVTAGSDAPRGELLVSAGDVLTPTTLAMVAAFGRDRISVAVRPRVALLSTGDEVRELGDVGHGAVCFSNSRHMLGWLAQLHGGIPVHLGVSKDDPVEMLEQVRGVEADVFITTGGTGKGDRDFVLEVWDRHGIMPMFQGVDISPGKGAMAGMKQGKMYLALPGSPWGARVIFEELIKPFLWRFQGASCRWPLTLKAELGESVLNQKGGRRVIAGAMEVGRCPISFRPAIEQGGSAFRQLRNRFAYMILDSHVLEISKGSQVDVRWFDLPLPAASLFVEGQHSDRKPPQGG